MRNEAHRFGITHHRNKRSKTAFGTELTAIKGIGEQTATQLLNQYKSVKRIKTLTLKELSQSVGLAKAKLIKNALSH